MAVRKFKPVTPGTRHKIIGTFDEIMDFLMQKRNLSQNRVSLNFLSAIVQII